MPKLVLAISDTNDDSPNLFGVLAVMETPCSLQLDAFKTTTLINCTCHYQYSASEAICLSNKLLGQIKNEDVRVSGTKGCLED